MAPLPPPAYLRHIHVPTIIPFQLATTIQNHLVNQHLQYKAQLSARPSPISSAEGTSASTSSPPPLDAPPPTILTFTPDPVYTLGRRESLSALSPSLLTTLHAPLSTTKPSPRNPYAQPEWASVEETQRGGQITFHGPGQVVIYPILDIKSGFPTHPSGLTVRSYVDLLEESTIHTLRRWGIPSTRTAHPGVWDRSGERKIAALGVHLRRNVASYGVGLNLSTDLRWFERIVACGLEGKSVTNMRVLREEEMGIPADRSMSRAGRRRVRARLEDEPEGTGWTRLKPATVVRAWVRAFARGLWGEGAQEEGRIRRGRVSELGLPEEVALRLEYGTKWGEDLDQYYS